MARNAGLSSWAAPGSAVMCRGHQGWQNLPDSSCLCRGVHLGLADLGRMQGKQAKAGASPRVPTMPPTLLCPSLPRDPKSCTTSHSNLHLCRPGHALHPCCISLLIPICTHGTLSLPTTLQQLRLLTKAEKPSRHPGSMQHCSPTAPKRRKARSIGPQRTSSPCQGSCQGMTPAISSTSPCPHSSAEGQGMLAVVEARAGGGTRATRCCRWTQALLDTKGG